MQTPPEQRREGRGDSLGELTIFPDPQGLNSCPKRRACRSPQAICVELHLLSIAQTGRYQRRSVRAVALHRRHT